MPPVRWVQVVSVTVRLMPLVRALWLSCQASVVGVGPCAGSQWLVSGRGLPLFPGGRWRVALALTGRVCSDWCGLLVMLLVTALQAMPRVMSSVRLVLVAPRVWVPLVTLWWMASCARLRWRGCCC